MKTFSAMILILLAAGLPAAAQEWENVRSPFDQHITGICAVHADTLFLVTDKGQFARTVDGGWNWQVTTVADKVHLEDVSFIDSRLGVACGRNGALWLTTDGGANWQSKSLPDTLPWFMDVEMFDAATGLVIGMPRDSANPLDGLAFRTTDSGQTWHKIERIGMGYTEICYQPGAPVYLLSFGYIHRSDDLGGHWNTVKIPDGMAARAISIEGRTGIMAGPSGMFAWSTDSGKTWTNLGGWSNQLFIAAQLVDESIGYAGGYEGVMKRTTDGGKTWHDDALPRKFTILDMCLAGNRLFAVGQDGNIIAKKVR